MFDEDELIWTSCCLCFSVAEVVHKGLQLSSQQTVQHLQVKHQILNAVLITETLKTDQTDVKLSLHSSFVQHVDGARVDAVISTSQQHDLEIKEDVAETQVDSSGSLIRHAWSHVDESQTVCGVCGDRLESEGDLKGHLRKHQKTFDCSQCGKPFFTLHSLNRHNSLHTGERPFTCNVCNKSFTHMSILTTHRWVHVADKPHKCDICQKSFGLKAQLRAHCKLHTGRDKYICNICGLSLYDQLTLSNDIGVFFALPAIHYIILEDYTHLKYCRSAVVPDYTTRWSLFITPYSSHEGKFCYCLMQ
uniref:C2H2-type domain-containing protein n=1 Tax=Amphiprion ocellaris TaxID=80972 RepID=A0AAQ6AGK6_AMPOC